MTETKSPAPNEGILLEDSAPAAPRPANPPEPGSSLFELMRRGSLRIPRRHRAQKSFFRFLKRAGSDRRFLEEIGRLRDAVVLSALRDEKTDARGLTVGLLGVRGGEGTSLMALLLGLALGECTQRRIAFLDGRFNVQRFEVLSNLLSLARNSVNVQKGFTDITGYYNERNPNVFFLRNTVEERSVHFFSDRRLGFFLSELRQQFDFTVLDLPPLLKETASVFALPHLDRVYLVVESGRTRLVDIEKCLETASQAGCSVHGILLNKQSAPWWSRLFWRDFFF
jgi:hypothetical protein